MKTIKISSILISLGAFLSVTMAWGQQTAILTLDQELSHDFKTMIQADYTARFDSLAPSFKKRLSSSLLIKETLTYPFDSLSKGVRIVTSQDKLFRIYSWDEQSGGSWHNMAAFAQFASVDGTVNVKQLDSDKEIEYGTFTDVIIYEIHDIEINGQTYYLTIGWGTHGSGHHHSLAQIFGIEGNQLIKYSKGFASVDDLVIQAPRRHTINMTYDNKTGQLTYNEFALNDALGFYEPTGKTVTWELQQGVFVKKQY